MKPSRLFLFTLLAAASAPAFAYVGPGAGLTLLGALWGLLAAVGAALMFVIVWPLRQWRKRVNAERRGVEVDDVSASGRKGEAQAPPKNSAMHSDQPPAG
jgi:membrane protein implicated in regulation of membrane protease activity